ncbi:FAD-dependent oxidoreductase, partial [Microbacteriaceae bacterium K1510]|nr:FAD-dependent oxidoreductase [Microbacteriaceae bacterium K1510]
VIAERQEIRITRREFLQRSALFTAGLTVPGMLWNAQNAHAKRKSSSTSQEIVIIGAGLAGLSCAYRLQQAGYRAKVYEASNRVGGRCWTRRGDFEDGQIAEHGGELIDRGHTNIKQLVQELGLELDNLL